MASKRLIIKGLVLIFLGTILLWSGLAAASPGFLSAKNVTRVGHLDLEGGGMVDVKGNLAAVGHMGPPWATTLLDMADPTHPRSDVSCAARHLRKDRRPLRSASAPRIRRA